MIHSPETVFYYPNKMGRIVLLAMEEVLGRNGVNAVLNRAVLPHRLQNYPPNNLDRQVRFLEISQMQQAMEEIYGPRAGRGLALRSGRVCFKHGLREFGPVMGFTDLSFRLLPLENKLQSGAEVFAEIFNRYTDQRVRVEVQPDRLFWHIERCPLCWQRSTKEPACHLAVGILQEALYWVSGGKQFAVQETSCIAKGDPLCTIEVDKQALD